MPPELVSQNRLRDRDNRTARVQNRRAAEAATRPAPPVLTVEERARGRAARAAQMPAIRAAREAAKHRQPAPLRERVADLELQLAEAAVAPETEPARRGPGRPRKDA
jgi:hypothetical protein